MSELAENNKSVVLDWNDLAFARRQPEAAVAKCPLWTWDQGISRWGFG
jgi:hypothetical protein